MSVLAANSAMAEMEKLRERRDMLWMHQLLSGICAHLCTGMGPAGSWMDRRSGSAELDALAMLMIGEEPEPECSRASLTTMADQIHRDIERMTLGRQQIHREIETQRLGGQHSERPSEIRRETERQGFGQPSVGRVSQVVRTPDSWFAEAERLAITNQQLERQLSAANQSRLRAEKFLIQQTRPDPMIEVHDTARLRPSDDKRAGSTGFGYQVLTDCIGGLLVQMEGTLHELSRVLPSLPTPKNLGPGETEASVVTVRVRVR
eukprot:TRINITY_DN5529_c0_g1_i2.p1 TRINITY_DN5529_c0_g1~~TRINITY_DN5529_c0_g1_i2.p1  ORF type:complete len:262 (+),score=39.05 TRINITY_DN5529_c0_g1_i2:225-1010(+)